MATPYCAPSYAPLSVWLSVCHWAFETYMKLHLDTELVAMDILAYLFLFATYSYSVCKHIVNTFAFISYSLNCWPNRNELQWISMEMFTSCFMVSGNRYRLRTGMPRSPW